MYREKLELTWNLQKSREGGAWEAGKNLPNWDKVLD